MDPSDQRSVDNTASRALIIRIAKNWDRDSCEPLVVSQREDRSLFVVDGQHRLAAAIMRGDIEQLPCFVCALPDLASEADRFVQFNKNRKSLSSLDLWKASVASGDPVALEITGSLERAGLRVSGTTNNTVGTNALTNIGGLQRCYRKQGLDQLSAVLDVLANAYRGEVMQYAGTVFTGIAAVVADEFRPGWSESTQRTELIEFVKSKKQVKWFSLVQVELAESGGVRQQVAETVFREAWTKWHQKQPQQVQPIKPAPQKLSFEEQLRRVEAGEVGICENVRITNVIGKL